MGGQKMAHDVGEIQVKDLNTTHFQFQQAADHLGMSDEMRAMLITPYRELTVQIPVRMDDGRLAVFNGFRIQHNGARGPYKGGLRYHPEVDHDEVLSLASLMTWKTALIGIPMGGAKGGVSCNPRNMSQSEVQRLTRAFVSKIHLMIGPYRDIPAPDMNTNPQVMAWIMDEYGKIHGFNPGVVTGKPVSLGGSLGRNEATGRGVAMVTRAYGKRRGLPVEGARVVIQGFGNVGSHAAMILEEMGAKIIAVGDIDATLFNPNGLNAKKLGDFAAQNKSIKGFPDCEEIDPNTLLETECDYLIPAALGGVITKFNADKIKAKVVVEAANSPTTTNADLVLEDRGIVVIPDILANAGGVTVSYFEWVQNIQQYKWDLERVNTELEKLLLGAFDRVMDRAEKENCSLRLAAYLFAIQEVADAVTLRGLS